MADLSDTVSDQVSESKEVNHQECLNERGSSVDGADIKTCADCGTTKTPLWRGGPAGPKSLCNACGIRSRKKRRALLGINKEDKKPKKSTLIKQSSHQMNNNSMSSSNNSSSSEESSSKMGEISLKKKLLSFGGKVAFQRPRSSIINQRRKLGEVEQAAFLLMALSCGSVYA